MVKLISHRGNIIGPDPSNENKPDTILHALNSGYDCEIDIWYFDNVLYLGHDRPEYPINHDFITAQGLWIHAKNLAALHYLSKYSGLEFFWHQQDDYTLTSSNRIWTYPGRNLTIDSIAVMPESYMPIEKLCLLQVYGICSDYVGRITYTKDTFNE